MLGHPRALCQIDILYLILKMNKCCHYPTEQLRKQRLSMVTNDQTFKVFR